MSTLRKFQSSVYFKEDTRDSLFRQEFGLPDGEECLAQLHAVLSLDGKEEAYSGKLYLSQSYMTFSSSDRRSCKLTLPLATVRRVEKLAPGQDGIMGAFALSLTLFHGSRIVLQLNSLRHTNDAFCGILKTRLKASLSLMKSLKPFSKTFFSEYFLAPENDELLLATRKEIDSKFVGVLIELEEKVVEEKELGWITTSGTGAGYHGGLGLIYKFPGDPKKLREKSKMKLWKDYMNQHGRNLTLIRYPSFTRLVQVGLPNRLRGEIWELTCGSLFLRLNNPGIYLGILKDNVGRTNASTEDIEKDLHRSLPEYPAYQQDGSGIGTMRRVLTAYAFSNPQTGYCQAMNLVVASFLIFMSEEQCFWCLSILCDRLLPGYYSPSMYGTVLDQRVFEHLVERCLPTLHDHFTQADIQISIASLPWFLSCYISAMPLIFAFRIVDNLFLNGPKVLFQVGLAILRINGELLLDCVDDGMFINAIKGYFATLGESANPESKDSRVRAITRFQELLVVAFREFSDITDETITAERKRHRKAVVISIETFAKRSQLRNLQVGKLSKDQLSKIYDHYQLALLKDTEQASTKEEGKEDEPQPRIGRRAFGLLVGGIATFARDEQIVRNGFHEHIERTPADHHFIDSLFSAWNVSKSKLGINLQDFVTGLEQVLSLDLLSGISWMFSLHDGDQDGYLTKDELLAISESLLFIFRNEHGDRYLGAVSNMLHNAFEYAESTKPVSVTESDPHQPLVNQDPALPYIGLATFRMVVLAEELLESLFESDFRNSWKLEALIAEEPKIVGGAVGWLNGLMSNLVTDDNKNKLNELANLAGKSLNIHSVQSVSSLGKLDKITSLLDPIERGSLVNQNSSPVSSLNSTPIIRTPSAFSTLATKNPWATEETKSDLAVDVAFNESLLERPTQFGIDQVVEEEEEYDFGDDEDGILNDVDTFLKGEVGGDVAISSEEVLSRDVEK